MMIQFPANSPFVPVGLFIVIGLLAPGEFLLGEFLLGYSRFTPAGTMSVPDSVLGID